MDVAEGDLIEIGQLGAYGAAMGTRFNGFGDTVTIMSGDAPWPSMYGTVEAAKVVRIAKPRARKPRTTR